MKRMNCMKRMNRVNRVVISGSRAVYRNLALEEALLEALNPGELVLYLWVNDRTVILGNNQCACLEYSPGYCRSRNIAVARRRSGGGAVYQDCGNLNFTLLFYRGEAEMEALQDMIRAGIEAASGCPVQQSGNDFLVDGRKITGMAYYEEDGKMLLHGTILVNADLGTMAEALTVRARKLRSKGVDSVRKRVANLAEFVPGIQVEHLEQQLALNFVETYGHGEILHMETADMPGDPARYESPEWIYGESPEYEMMEEAWSENGLYQLVFRVEQERIRDPHIYSDSDVREDHRLFLGHLEGRIYEETELKRELEHYVNGLSAVHNPFRYSSK